MSRAARIDDNQPKKRAKALSRHEETFALHVRAAGLQGGMMREYVFHPHRKWRFDFAFPAKWIAVEIEGGIWMKQGAHTGGAGVTRDIEKANAAISLGWRVMRFTGDMVKSGEAIRMVEEALKR